jgi:peptidoglycan/xylan/chitin deacetylase (PgdA/CDA1 family)
VTDVPWDASSKHVMLTFDDGGASAPYIGETLLRHGWRGHFFIVTSLIGTSGFADAAGIRALREQGHIVGSHSHSHPDIFRDLSAARMEEEWRSSRSRLNDLLGEPCVTASVPGGDSSSAVLRAAAEAGYAYVFTSDPDPRPVLHGGGDSACRVLGRFVVKSSHTADQVARLARGEGWQQALFMRRLRVAATWALPGLYRQYVAFRTQAHES